MGKLYRTNEIEELINEKIKNDSAKLIYEIGDGELDDEQFIRFVKELNIFRKYADELLEEMDEQDLEYDNEMGVKHE